MDRNRRGYDSEWYGGPDRDSGWGFVLRLVCFSGGIFIVGLVLSAIF